MITITITIIIIREGCLLSIFRDVLVLCYLKTEKVSRTECGRNSCPLAVINLLINKLINLF